MLSVQQLTCLTSEPWVYKESILLGINCLLWGFIINSNLCLAYKSVDPILEPYTFDYYKLVEDRCPQKYRYLTDMYTIQFIDKSDDFIGVCLWRYHGYKIQINKDWWDGAAEFEKRQLMYHELAHCVINRQHVDNPGHYMNPYTMPIPYNVYIKQVIEDINNYCAAP